MYAWRKPKNVFVNTPANEVSPSISPDGRWMAYASNESGRPEIYVRSFPGAGTRHQVSLDGGEEPVIGRAVLHQRPSIRLSSSHSVSAVRRPSYSP